MSIAIAVSGKGGTGKTTLCGLMVAYLKKKKKTPILAIDADANSNLNEVLGVKEPLQAIGALREELLKNVERIPAGVPKESWVEYQLAEALTEEKGFDLLTMGRPEGPGCYCYVNSVLRKYIDLLAGNYPYIVMDNEAGMEHLSRQTTKNADFLLIISDATPRGIRTAARIRDLAKTEELKIGQIFLVVNRLSGSLSAELKKQIAQHELNLLGTVEEDSLIGQFEMAGKPLFDLPDDAPSLVAMGKIVDKLIEAPLRAGKEVA